MNIVGHIFRPLSVYKRHIGTYRTDFYPAVTGDLTFTIVPNKI